MILVFFLIVLGVTHKEVRSDTVVNNRSGHFSVKDEDLKPNTIWTVHIIPPNSTYIFVVLEEIILGNDDSLSIVGGENETLNETKGTHDPFSFLFEGKNVMLVLNISGDRMNHRVCAGYYTVSGCTYQLNETSGRLSTPQLYVKDDTASCNFSVSALHEMTSKVSVAFLKFQLNKSELHIIVDETDSYNYKGSSIPPEIISEKMELSFMLHKNDTAQFSYGHVLKESAYIVLNSSSPRHRFSYQPSPEKTYYPYEQECHWVVQSDENTTISFEFSLISSKDRTTYVLINDGKNYLSKTLFFSSLKEDLKYRYTSSSGNFLWISIEQPEENTLILAEATMHKNGGYKTGNGKLSVPLNSTKVVYLVEEEEDENVVLSEHNGRLTSNSTIHVYDDFSNSSAPIAVFNASLPSYPIVSSTSKMMVVAITFGENATYEANYEAVKKGCYKMSTTENGQYELTGNCSATCKWIVPPVKAMDKVISLHLYPLKPEKHDVITLNLLDAKQTMIANITSKELPEFYLPLSSGFLLNIVRGTCSASPMLHATFEKRQGCSAAHELSPGTSVSVKSPNFPDTYPFWSHCWTNITAAKTTKNGRFLLTFSKIDLAATHCLRIRSNIRNSSEVIQTYEGIMGALPGDLIINDTASVEFLAQPCNSTKKELLNPTTSSGFHLDILSADCGGKLALKEGNFSTPGFPKNTSVSVCIWLLEVPQKEIINFTLSRNITPKDVEFKIYDGPSIHNETMKNHSALTLLSRTNSLIFIYHRNSSSKTSPGIQVTFHSQECLSRCQNGLCIHDDWKCDGVNNCGDNTDEIDCKGVPVSPTTTAAPQPEKSYGVSSVALGLGIPIAFILGILATIYLPPLIRRFRSGQYHQFRDVSADA